MAIDSDALGSHDLYQSYIDSIRLELLILRRLRRGKPEPTSRVQAPEAKIPELQTLQARTERMSWPHGPSSSTRRHHVRKPADLKHPGRRRYK